MKSVAAAALLAALPFLVKADYDPANLPATTEQGQTGTNKCDLGHSSQSSMCQNVFVNSVTDFCLWAPPQKGTIGDTETEEVAWCLKSGYGTRLIPDGTIHGAHFVKTPSYVQVTGVGDFTKMNIADKDEGGELDPHGATGVGNPIGGLFFTNAFSGQYQQIHEWTNFMSYNEFCIRGCVGNYAAQWCQHIYDTMGCYWNMPANYDANVFENCESNDSGEWPGVYSGSTWYQGQSPTPSAQRIPSSSNCAKQSSVHNAVQTNYPGAKGARKHRRHGSLQPTPTTH